MDTFFIWTGYLFWGAVIAGVVAVGLLYAYAKYMGMP